MPSWDGIEDASSTAPRIWLSREKPTDEFKPLRKVDCRALNNSKGGTVLIEGGRATADLDSGIIFYNFYNAPKKELVGSAWFVREEKSSKEIVLHPISEADGAKIEDLYQRAITASSSLGEGLDKVLNEEIQLEEDSFKVVLMKVGGNLSMKKRSKSMFGPSFNLQRGYGEYCIEGEDDEVTLGPVQHLIFAVHGIGEAMWSREDVSVPGLISQTDSARAEINRKQVELWKADCTLKAKKGEPQPPPPNRIEILPIEWYNNIHSASSALKNTLMATTLRNIPRLRAIANDVVFDVLMYLTPDFCEEVLDCVTTQVTDVYNRFHVIHPDFKSKDGKCSIMGHSLGSVIVWDMLSVLKDFKESKQASTSVGHDAAHIAYAKEAGEMKNAAKHGYWGPSLNKRMTKTIPFVPEYTIFLGSPLGLFLSLRGAHPVFEELRIASEAAKPKPKYSCVDEGLSAMVTESKESFTSPFTLPSGALYNIFHPSDPVAYRIEPLLLPPGTADKDVPSPAFLTPEGKGIRLHVQVQEISRSLTKRVSGLFGTFDKAVAAAAELVGGDDSNIRVERGVGGEINVDELKFALGGKNCRVDYQLQPGVIDNEYLSAISAHGSYFTNDDLLEFLIQITKNLCKEEVEKEESASFVTNGIGKQLAL